MSMIFEDTMQQLQAEQKNNHSIPLHSIQNARELGGYITADGRRITNGLLLRTASLNGISDGDIRLLTKDYRVQHIIDFRMAMEMMGAEDPRLDGSQYHHLDVIDLSSLPVQEMPEVDIKTLNLIQVIEMSEQVGMLEENMYIGFLASETGKKAYADFFRILLAADPERAVLWHCTGGKDRTGLAAMLILSALGVDEETVVKDYLLTNEYNAQRIAGTKQHLKAQGYDDALIKKATLVFDAVDERFMRNALAWIKKEYGSAPGYIRDGLNISDEEINSLKEKYLN